MNSNIITPENIGCQQRIQEEFKQLEDNIESLSSFIDSDIFENLDQKDAGLLLKQEDAMKNYYSILDARIQRFKSQQ